MTDQQHGPAGELLPAVVPSAALVPMSPAALVRAPMEAAALMQATVSAMTEAMAQMMRPWLVGVPVAPPQTATPAQTGGWSGPGVHISYTHLEVHWPLGR
jgi:hypothetical protein